jgi:5-methylcytosine-specific restriction endonuclease McrA
MTEYKACSRCKQTKPINQFGIHRKTSDGHYSQCLICHRQARGEQRIRRAAKIKLEQKANYQKNRDKRIAYANARIYQDPERSKRYNAISKKRNHLAVAANTRRRNARRKFNGVYAITKKELERLNRGPCFYCGSTQQITIDHVVAIARGGVDGIGNLVPACKSCNSQKRELTIMEWKLKKDRVGSLRTTDPADLVS